VLDSSCKLLLIDSDPSDAALAGRLLGQSFPDCELVIVSDAVAFAEQLAAGGFSTVISEQTLGWASGMDVLATFSRQYPHINTILFASSVPPDIYRLQRGAGAFACLQKSSAGFLQLAEVVESMLQAEQEKEGARGFWNRMLKQLDQPALTVLADGRVAEANAAAAMILGYQNADELSGLGLLSLFDLDADAWFGEEGLLGRLAALVNASVEQVEIRAAPLRDVQRIGQQRLTIHSIPGSPFLVLLYHGSPAVHSPSNQGSEYQQQYEQLLYAVSHDLQEPLQLVSRHADLLKDAYKDILDADGARFIGNLASNAQLMQSMLDDLLEYSRIGRLGPVIGEVDLNEVVDDVLMLYSHKLQEMGGQVRHSGLPIVRADRGQIVRLFQNLIGNAIKFHGKKKLKVSISAVERARDWEVMIEDNGIGIVPEQLESVFTMFKRLHTQESIPGNGMGLALCERIVKAHGGRIWVQPRDRKSGGVVFHFTLNKADSNHSDKQEVGS
jgi:signal transduction histidine kinase